ncbi:hypothetical protein JQ615_03245 [Bradyrhizobium jicamae]|uniref:Uncharacterized protein n=1 Tax=Bradyrhizobium jicamae TaxID=280332 RepID=A0ABS5FC82_9BRAD|nr:hypothetical protein [Bradyrhizobium jicamae]MBR0794398.1 hypothetical protein [Bradyrhizobium jicamae]MBR0933548.1 hypothetical protein [Bradyrhizobium jicamae]
MRWEKVSAALLGLVGVVASGAAQARAPARCRAEVVRSEELPYAPIGSWLLKATVRITDPHGQVVESTFLKNVPWQVTLRRGQAFRIDCDRLRDSWPVSWQVTR